MRKLIATKAQFCKMSLKQNKREIIKRIKSIKRHFLTNVVRDFKFVTFYYVLNVFCCVLHIASAEMTFLKTAYFIELKAASNPKDFTECK